MTTSWIKRQTSRINPSAQQGLALVVATNLAYVLDYFFNFAAGRLLTPEAFSIIISLAGLSNVMVVGSQVVQTVVSRYISEFAAKDAAVKQLPSFFRAVWRKGWRWGTAVTLLALILSFPIAAWLQIEEVRIVMALAVTTLLFVVRPIAGGTLQGVQQFAQFGMVHLVQAIFRLSIGIGLVLLGWGAFGAMVALPIASAIALAYNVRVLDKRVWQSSETHHGVSIPEMFRYSIYTAVGLLSYAVLVNMDAILVRRFFDPTQAGNYSAAVTLGKIIQFTPVAVMVLLFPKAVQRQASKQDPAKVLLPALTAVLVLCGGLVVGYTLFTDFIIRLTVGGQYEVSSLVLGLLGVGLTLLALSNLWLYYFLSIEQTAYVKFLACGILFQAVLMFMMHDALWQLPLAITINGGLLVLVGFVLFWKGRRGK